jgi:hypothetical protein
MAVVRPATEYRLYLQRQLLMMAAWRASLGFRCLPVSIVVNYGQPGLPPLLRLMRPPVSYCLPVIPSLRQHPCNCTVAKAFQ